MRIVFLGTSNYSCKMLRTIISAGYYVPLVVTLPDRPVGRGNRTEPTPVKKFADREGIPCIAVGNMKDPILARRVSEADADLGVVVSFRILPKEVYNAPKMGTVNVHPSLLPELRGPAPTRWAIIRGYQKTGVTTFRITDRIDSGDIFLKESLDIDRNETHGELFERIEVLSARLLIKTIEGLSDGSLEPVIQDHTNATSAPKITGEIRRIDWGKSALEVHNLVRGLSPSPGAWTLLDSKNIRILRTRLIEGSGQPGEIIECDPRNGLAVACGENALRVMKLQPSGKRAMDACSFLCGRSLETGVILR